jgi:alpha-tubulin suppressor-like RCC1 family protein
MEIYGSDKSMFIRLKDGLYGWGSNKMGQLGIGNKENQYTPTLVQLPKDAKIKKVVSGNSHTAFLLEEGSLYVCGDNEKGQLGLSSDKYTKWRSKPTLVYHDREIQDVWAHDDITIMLIRGTEGDELYACGDQYFGTLGIGKIKENKVFGFTLIPFFKGSKIKNVYLSSKHSLVLLEDGSLYGFGHNTKGMLDSTLIDTEYIKEELYHWIHEPVLLNHLKGKPAIKDIFPAADHIIAHLEDDSLYIWGSNDVGQLGYYTTSKVQHIPERITFFDGKKIKKVTTGCVYSMVLLEDGSFYVWGWNRDGQLGFDPEKMQFIPIPTPISFFKDRKVIDIFASSRHAFALTDDGRIYSWGYNFAGELGSGHICETKFTPSTVKSDLIIPL